jgi:hypothetical protein
MCLDISLYDFRVLAKTFDFVMISHIDDDHITGILDLTRELVMAKEAHGAPVVRIRSVWHNTFDDILGNAAQELATAVHAHFGAASLGGHSGTDGLNDVSAKVLASVPRGSGCATMPESSR